jgi:hypothetical protein
LRGLTCWREGDCLLLWIHPPECERGYDFRVPAVRLFAVLARALPKHDDEPAG